MTPTTETIRQLVSRGTAYLNAPPKRIPSDTVVDAPLLGNGDLGAAIAGDGAKQIFCLGKNDFWTQVHLSETPAQRRTRLLTQEGRRSGSRIVAAGYVEIDIEELKGCSYDAWQDPYLAEVRAEYRKEKAAARYTSRICAQQNTLMIEIENIGSLELSIRFSMMPGAWGSDEVYGYADGIQGESVYTAYPAEPYDLPGRRWVYSCLSSIPAADYTDLRMVRKGGNLVLKPSQRAQIVFTMLSDRDAKDAQQEAFRINEESKANWESLIEKHRAWWKNYWSCSLVETGNEYLDGFYYASLYLLGSAVREGKTPPGLFGPWITTDRPKWTGSYTLNYNFQSPFFCLYGANRQEIVSSYPDPLLDILPIGRMYAKEKFGRRGIALPVEIGPFGMVCSSIFHNQKTNAAYCCCNLFMHYFTTFDEDYGRRSYPFIKETAEFWEDDLVWEPEKERYSVVGDSLHEEYARTGGEKNNTHALGLLRMLFSGILALSEELGLDAEKREHWKHILEHLSDFPTFEMGGKTVFRFNEDNYAWRETSNGTSVKFIYPFGCIGLDSSPEQLAIARDTLQAKSHLFDNGNAFCEYTAMCARTGINPQLLYDKLIWQCQKRSMPNKYIWHGGGGIEDCTGVPSGIQEMMLQSHQGVVRVFPAWPEKVNASFVRLRAYGAFLVTSKIEQGKVMLIEISSEKGKPLTLVLPWEAELTRNDAAAGHLSSGTVRLETQPGETLVFVPSALK